MSLKHCSKKETAFGLHSPFAACFGSFFETSIFLHGPLERTAKTILVSGLVGWVDLAFLTVHG